MRRRARGSLLLQVASIASLLCAWDLLVRFQVYRFGYIPSPDSVLSTGIQYLASDDFRVDVVASTYRILVAWLTAVAIGVPLGLLIGWKIWFNNLVFPVIELLRPIPPIAWIPAGILFFSEIQSSVIFICFIGSFFPIVLNTVVGVSLIDKTCFRAASCLGAEDWRVFRDVVIPGALPSIIVGLAVGMGINWMSLVAAEMIAGDHGLGYRIWEAYNLAQYPRIIVVMLIIGVIGATMSLMIRYLGHRLVPWQL
jgi:NitT/TauT family transport system permease protein